ncbi:MAG: B12-binding domain-containing radical SAM protein [Alphaproteobacteria bacterium]
MRRIALIFPPTVAVTVMPPLGLGILAAVLRDAGHEVRIFDLARRHLTITQLQRTLADWRPSLVGMSVMTPNFAGAQAVGQMLRELPERPLVAVGGAHVSVYPERSLDDFHADYAFVREGEETLPAVIAALDEGRDPAAIPGVVFCREGKVVDTGPAPLIGDIDRLPWAAWELLEPEKYPPIPHQLFVRRLPVAPILTTRGCPFNCSFCATTWLFGSHIRCRDPQNVVDEMIHLADRHGIREFHIEDDNPTLVREHIDNFCHALINTGRQWVWKFPNGVMVNTLDDELIRLMAEAGCYQISLGIETLSESTHVGKTVEFERLDGIIAAARKVGMQTQGLFVVGLPNEDEKTIRTSIVASTKLGLDFAHYGAFVPLPGSKWGNEIMRAGTDFTNINFFTASGLVAHGPQFVKRIQRQAILRFYLRPKILWNLLKMVKLRQLGGVLYTARRYLLG